MEQLSYRDFTASKSVDGVDKMILQLFVLPRCPPPTEYAAPLETGAGGAREYRKPLVGVRRESESIENPWRESEGSQRVYKPLDGVRRVSESIQIIGGSQKGVIEYTNH